MEVENLPVLILEAYIKLSRISFSYDISSLVGIINPSKFEGWSSSVEQAKSMGKKVILSNINIHKEQNPDRGVYFNADDNKKLANILMNEYKKFNSSKEKKIINNTYLKSNKNLFNYYLEYEKIVDDLF